MLTIIGNNIAGLTSKKESLINLVNTVKPAVGMFQETKLYKKGQLKLENYCIFESIRGEKQGGGLMTIVHSNFEPVLIPQKNEIKMAENVLVVEAKLGQSRVRYINAYGVQETAPVTEKMEFLTILDQEIENAKNNERMICIQMDANAKFGSDVIKGDPHKISANGELLLDLITRKSLILVNSTDKCSGVITRMRVKGNKKEESTLDYFIVCENFYIFCVNMDIDEERKYTLKRFYKSKNGNKVILSDHNPLFLHLKIPWNFYIRKPRLEIFNLRNKKAQEEFYKMTNENQELTKCLENQSVVTGGKNWIKSFKNIIQKTFRKIRIKRKQEDIEIQNLLNKKKNVDDPEIDQEICEKIYENIRNKIMEQIHEMTDRGGNMSRVKMWKIKQKVCPRYDVSDQAAKMDKNGNLICDRTGLKNLYVEVYKERLRHRPIQEDYQSLKRYKEFLFELRLKLAKTRKSEDWTTTDIEKVFKNMKTKKAADPVGLINELFKPGVAGCNLVESTLMLCNKMKRECRIPSFVKVANITSIFKKKGSKLDLNNDRGVFTVTCLRGIVDKLIYNDCYDIIEENMSDSNVGGRKNRGIRDNLFIVNGIINDAVSNNSNVDLSLYDIAKCFDAQWYEETMNDLWDVGVSDDKFALISEINSKCKIAIKTPVGQTDRFVMERIEMQGTVMGPIKASVQLDTLGRDCYERQEGLYIYKECVAVPPLMMIDDLASFSLCGTNSIISNAIINAKIACKKLEFGSSKCFNMHIGKEVTS